MSLTLAPTRITSALVWLVNDRIYVKRPAFSEDFRLDCRAIEGREWDGYEKSWNFPLASVPQVRALAEKWQIEISEDVTWLEGYNEFVSENKERKFNITSDGKHLWLEFDYNPNLIAVIHIHLPEADWKSKVRSYQIPLRSITEVIKFAQEFNLTMEPSISEQAEQIVSDAAVNYEASTAIDAPDLDIPGLMLPLRPHQRAGVAYMLRNRRVILGDVPGLGKGHPHGTPILTPNGWTKIEDLKVGDFVIGKDGHPTGVMGIYHRGVLPVYRVSFSDKSSILVDGDHLWPVQRTTAANRHPDRYLIKDTRSLTTDYREKDGKWKWSIPMVNPVHFTDPGTLPIDPYLLGLLLGDGGIGGPSINFTTADEFIAKKIREVLPEDLSLKKTTSEYGYRISTYRAGFPNQLRRVLDDLDLRCLSGNKHIPGPYLLASPEDRLALLRGLMDTDGNAGSDGTNEFVSVSKDLADGVAELVLSLGGVVRRSTKAPSTKNKKTPGPYQLAYRVNVKMMECPFLLPRKVAAWKKPTLYKPTRIIRTIEPEGEAPVICIAVAAEDHLYVAENYIVTHNSAQSISTAVLDASLPACVVCPNSLKYVWKRDIAKFYPDLRVEILNGGGHQEIDDADVIVINYDILHARLPDILAHGFKTLIIDESHYIKNGKKRSICPDCGHKLRINSVNCSGCGAKKISVVNSWSVRRTDAVMRLALSMPDDDLVLLLTGTPINNRPGELVRQLEAIGRLDQFGGEWKFRARYCPDAKTSMNLKELNTKLRETCFIRRLRKDVYDVDTEIESSPQFLAISPKDMKRYEEVEADVVEYFAEKARIRATDEGHRGDTAYWNKRRQLERAENLIRIAALRSVVAEIKFQSMIDWMDNFLDSGEEKIVVYAEHIETVEAIYARYEHMAVKIRGGVASEERDAIAEQFQTDPNIRVFVGNITAAKEGLTLTESSDVIFCELAWSPTHHEQCMGRCVIGGQLVHTSRGSIPVEKVDRGDKVLTHDNGWQEVLDVSSRYYGGEIVELEYTRNNRPLRVTPEHKVWIKDFMSGEIGWKEAREVKNGDYVALPRPKGNGAKELTFPLHLRSKAMIHTCSKCGEAVMARGLCEPHYRYDKRRGLLPITWPNQGLNKKLAKINDVVAITDDLLWAIGRWLGDGWVGKDGDRFHGVGICGHSKEIKDVERCARIFSEAFGIPYSPAKLDSPNCCSAILYSKELSSFFDHFFLSGERRGTGKGSQGAVKRIPAELITSMSQSQAWALFNGYISADGTQKGADGRRRWCSVSPHLAWQMGLLTAQSGFDPVMNKFNSRSHNVTVPTWEGHYNPRDTKNRRIDLQQSDDDYVWNPIVRKRNVIIDEMVYDLSVANSHSFVVEGAAVHNCTGRVNNPHGATGWYLLAPDTIDEKMYQMLQDKQKVIDAAIDGIEISEDNRSVESQMLDYFIAKGEEKIS